MRAVWIVALLALLPVQGAALSCMPHSVQAAYLAADAAEERYIIVQGRLDFDPRLAPRGGIEQQGQTPPRTEINARLTGKALSRDGFATPYDGPVTLVLECYGPWCAQAQSGGQVLALVQRGAQGDVVQSDPCGGNLFANPSAQMLRDVRQCFDGGACEALK